MNNAYAIRLNEENYGAIASEKPGFDLAEARAWVEEHGGGFFIRDEGYKTFDCQYMADLVFHQIYIFENFKDTDMFHRLKRIQDGKR